MRRASRSERDLPAGPGLGEVGRGTVRKEQAATIRSNFASGQYPYRLSATARVGVYLQACRALAVCSSRCGSASILVTSAEPSRSYARVVE